MPYPTISYKGDSIISVQSLYNVQFNAKNKAFSSQHETKKYISTLEQ